MRSKLLLAAPVLVLSLAIGNAALRPESRMAQPLTTTAGAEPIVYSGPATDSHAELARGIRKALDMEQWYAEAHRQELERKQADEAAAAARAKTASNPAPKPSDPAPVPSGGGSAEGAISAYFGDIFSQAWGVTGCESGHNPDAVSPGGGNWGLFQINTTHKKSFADVTGHPWTDVLDPYLNAQFARWLYDNSGGWGPWSCRWAAH